jgi:hypothetical protein
MCGQIPEEPVGLTAASRFTSDFHMTKSDVSGSGVFFERRRTNPIKQPINLKGKLSERKCRVGQDWALHVSVQSKSETYMLLAGMRSG